MKLSVILYPFPFILQSAPLVRADTVEEHSSSILLNILSQRTYLVVLVFHTKIRYHKLSILNVNDTRFELYEWEKYSFTSHRICLNFVCSMKNRETEFKKNNIFEFKLAPKETNYSDLWNINCNYWILYQRWITFRFRTKSEHQSFVTPFVSAGAQRKNGKVL